MKDFFMLLGNYRKSIVPVCIYSAYFFVGFWKYLPDLVPAIFKISNPAFWVMIFGVISCAVCFLMATQFIWTLVFWTGGIKDSNVIELVGFADGTIIFWRVFFTLPGNYYFAAFFIPFGFRLATLILVCVIMWIIKIKNRKRYISEIPRNKEIIVYKPFVWFTNLKNKGDGKKHRNPNTR